MTASGDYAPGEADRAGEVIRLRARAAALISDLLADYRAVCVAQDRAVQEAVRPELDALLTKLDTLSEAAEQVKAQVLADYLSLRDRIRAAVDEICLVERIAAESERAARIAAMPHCDTCGSHRLTPAGCLTCMYTLADKKPTPRKTGRVRA